MGSGILRRTALVDNSKGYPIYHDYCLVATSLGTCVEFAAPFQRGDIGSAFNPAAESVKVDEIVSLSTDVRPDIFFDTGTGMLLQELSNEKTGY
jgi:hypothetical protein